VKYIDKKTKTKGRKRIVKDRHQVHIRTIRPNWKEVEILRKRCLRHL
jgi:hypothetical protein